MDNYLENLRELAASGKLEAIIELVDYYLKEENYVQAYQTALRFEYLPFKEGYRKLAYFYQNGLGTEKNSEKALALYTKAYQMGDAPSGYNLALNACKSQEYTKAISYLSTGVEENYLPSIKLLANMYINGLGIIKDRSIAIKLLLKAYELGDKNSLDSIAKLYYVSGEYDKAFEYFNMGAQEKIPNCIYHLALSYAKGLGTKQDFAMARRVYEMGANLNEPRCLFNLAQYYKNGIGGVQNIELAAMLEKQAIQFGFKN